VCSSFTYTGREFEPELGMYYYRARYYDPNTGRFLQQDLDPGKLASPSTFLSKYIYAGNNPVMFGDPSGLSWLSELVDTVMGAGHNVIANLGAAFDNLVKDQGFQKLLVIALAFAGGLGGYMFASSPGMTPLELANKFQNIFNLEKTAELKWGFNFGSTKAVFSLGAASYDVIRGIAAPLTCSSSQIHGFPYFTDPCKGGK